MPKIRKNYFLLGGLLSFGLLCYEVHRDRLLGSGLLCCLLGGRPLYCGLLRSLLISRLLTGGLLGSKLLLGCGLLNQLVASLHSLNLLVNLVCSSRRCAS